MIYGPFDCACGLSYMPGSTEDDCCQACQDEADQSFDCDLCETECETQFDLDKHRLLVHLKKPVYEGGGCV